MESSGGKCFLMFCFILMGRLLDKSVGLVSDSSAMSGGHTIMCPIPGWTARGALNQPEKPWPSAADVEFTSKACIHSILSLRIGGSYVSGYAQQLRKLKDNGDTQD